MYQAIAWLMAESMGRPALLMTFGFAVFFGAFGGAVWLILQNKRDAANDVKEVTE